MPSAARAPSYFSSWGSQSFGGPARCQSSTLCAMALLCFSAQLVAGSKSPQAGGAAPVAPPRPTGEDLGRGVSPVPTSCTSVATSQPTCGAGSEAPDGGSGVLQTHRDPQPKLPRKICTGGASIPTFAAIPVIGALASRFSMCPSESNGTTPPGGPQGCSRLRPRRPPQLDEQLLETQERGNPGASGLAGHQRPTGPHVCHRRSQRQQQQQPQQLQEHQEHQAEEIQLHPTTRRNRRQRLRRAGQRQGHREYQGPLHQWRRREGVVFHGGPTPPQVSGAQEILSRSSSSGSRTASFLIQAGESPSGSFLLSPVGEAGAQGPPTGKPQGGGSPREGPSQAAAVGCGYWRERPNRGHRMLPRPCMREKGGRPFESKAWSPRDKLQGKEEEAAVGQKQAQAETRPRIFPEALRSRGGRHKEERGELPRRCGAQSIKQGTSTGTSEPQRTEQGALPSSESADGARAACTWGASGSGTPASGREEAPTPESRWSPLSGDWREERVWTSILRRALLGSAYPARPDEGPPPRARSETADVAAAAAAAAAAAMAAAAVVAAAGLLLP